MRAWQVAELGQPSEVLRLVDVPDPAPSPGQVVVRVLASAANFPDVLMCRGDYQVRPEVADGVQRLAGGQTIGRVAYDAGAGS